MSPNPTNEDIALIFNELQQINKRLPNGELTTILRSVTDIKSDLSEVKYIMLNPEDGLVVKSNKNTEFRLKIEEEQKGLVKSVSDLVNSSKELHRWKENVKKGLWILFTAVIGLFFAVLANIIRSGGN